MKFSKSKVTNPKQWLAIDTMFYNVAEERLVWVRGAVHPEGRGLPLLSVDFLAEGRDQFVRDGFGKNIPENDARTLVDSYPQRFDDDTFHSLLTEIIGRSIAS